MHRRYEDKDESQIPNSLLDEPALLPGLGIYYDAFWELSSDRSSGMGVGHIPYSSLMAYCKEWELDEDMAFLMKKLVRKMDNHFLDWQNKQEKKASKIKGK